MSEKRPLNELALDYPDVAIELFDIYNLAANQAQQRNDYYSEYGPNKLDNFALVIAPAELDDPSPENSDFPQATFFTSNRMQHLEEVWRWEYKSGSLGKLALELEISVDTPLKNARAKVQKILNRPYTGFSYDRFRIDMGHNDKGEEMLGLAGATRVDGSITSFDGGWELDNQLQSLSYPGHLRSAIETGQLISVDCLAEQMNCQAELIITLLDGKSPSEVEHKDIIDILVKLAELQRLQSKL